MRIAVVCRASIAALAAVSAVIIAGMRQVSAVILPCCRSVACAVGSDAWQGGLRLIAVSCIGCANIAVTGVYEPAARAGMGAISAGAGTALLRGLPTVGVRRSIALIKGGLSAVALLAAARPTISFITRVTPAAVAAVIIFRQRLSPSAVVWIIIYLAYL